MGQHCNDCGAAIVEYKEGEYIWLACKHCKKIFGAELNLSTMKYLPTTSCIKKLNEAQLLKK